MPIRRRANFVYLFAQRPPFIKQLRSYVGDGTQGCSPGGGVLLEAVLLLHLCKVPAISNHNTHPVNGG